MKNLGLLFFGLILLTSCKETPSGNTVESTTTSLEVINNSGHVDFWFVNSISVGGNQLYYFGSSNYEIRHGDKEIFSFTKENVGGDLNGLTVGVMLQKHSENVQKGSVSITLDFTLGEKRIVRVGCESFYGNPERCKGDSLTLVSVE